MHKQNSLNSYDLIFFQLEYNVFKYLTAALLNKSDSYVTLLF